jgi:uncharacterized protein with ParB-like and HNH nuclease domain
MINFKNLPKVTKRGSYQISVPINDIGHTINRYKENGLIEIPDFQRGHVWTEEQRIKFIEHILSGGEPGVLYFNHPDWMNFSRKEGYLDFVVVDGLQRLTSILMVLNNKIKAFGYHYNEIEGFIDVDITININNLKTRKEVLKWYLEMNSNGTPHTKDEIEKVKNMLDEEN